MDPASLAAWLVRLASIDPALARLATRVVSVAVTAVALWVVYRLVIRLIGRGVAGSPRARTLGSLLANLTRWVLAFVLLVIVLRELGVDVQALLVSAGIVGVAIGFGAQTLVRDLIAGLFLLFEGLLAIGDVVEVGGQRGTVEGIGLRVTRLRLLDGSVRVVPNGQLTDFVNLSSDWARVLVDVSIPRAVDVGGALEVLERAGREWGEATGGALEPPRAHGIMTLSGAEMVLRLAVRVDPARRFDAEVELRRRIKEALDREPRPAGGAS
jgi:small conductance mechanosensitive channel